MQHVPVSHSTGGKRTMSGNDPAAQPGNSKAKKPRNPIERLVVWGGIAALLVLVAVEAMAAIEPVKLTLEQEEEMKKAGGARGMMGMGGGGPGGGMTFTPEQMEEIKKAGGPRGPGMMAPPGGRGGRGGRPARQDAADA